MDFLLNDVPCAYSRACANLANAAGNQPGATEVERLQADVRYAFALRFKITWQLLFTALSISTGSHRCITLHRNLFGQNNKRTYLRKKHYDPPSSLRLRR